MPRDTGIADRLRAAGLRVVEVAGWQTRGSTSFNPRGSVDHHTAGAASGNAPSLSICINGRAGLAGPLCNVLIGRDNTCYVIAAGRANHAGTGGWRGLSGNSSVYGVERENVGYADREPWREDQTDTAARVHAALIRGRADASMVCRHAEWTTRKIDTHSIIGDELRARVGHYLNPPVVSAPVGGDRLAPGQALNPGQYIVSNSGVFSLHYQGDGNLVVYRNGNEPIWASNTPYGYPGYFVMQTDGNAVVYGVAGNAAWATGTHGNPGACLVMQDDGNLVVYSRNMTPLWATGTPRTNPTVTMHPEAYPILKRGSKGTAVTLLQEKLRHLGVDIAVDGVFGPRTQRAVVDTQRFFGLVPDGVVGPKTWGLLDYLLSYR